MLGKIWWKWHKLKSYYNILLLETLGTLISAKNCEIAHKDVNNIGLKCALLEILKSNCLLRFTIWNLQSMLINDVIFMQYSIKIDQTVKWLQRMLIVKVKKRISNVSVTNLLTVITNVKFTNSVDCKDIFLNIMEHNYFLNYIL